ncbi:MAG: ribbon-helix-helix protein, CopG family [Acidimicrobiales bacterium]|nr:ribbon-helix-helix protein, CopG family [Acidimicrobiales bacterium]MXX43152.1 ribbon-helix-helix protein, CopG family [Acidimicrobiales bacterium]MYB82085.1 ribbon-helix-helix protein, CopG family [Acidimicrobiales bacterium]MYD34097.1 ribbon-helix-helix protein, CopG family [Acidimicrobiales bacterium]MYI08164.1 ribbon-helix-helix protein, CopG family [Acidimicrobiales bacterium]
MSAIYCAIHGILVRVKQTTIYLPDDLKERLERAAAKARCSEAALVREALVEALARREARPTTPLFNDGWGDPDIAVNVDEHLARTGFGT